MGVAYVLKVRRTAEQVPGTILHILQGGSNQAERLWLPRETLGIQHPWKGPDNTASHLTSQS